MSPPPCTSCGMRTKGAELQAEARADQAEARGLRARADQERQARLAADRRMETEYRRLRGE